MSERIVAAALRVENPHYGGPLVISQVPPARHHTLLTIGDELLGWCDYPRWEDRALSPRPTTEAIDKRTGSQVRQSANG